MGQQSSKGEKGDRGEKGEKGDKGDKGDNATINYPILSQNLITDNNFANSIKNTITNNASLFKGKDGKDGRGVDNILITNGTLYTKMSDGATIQAYGEMVGAPGRDGRGIKRIDYNNRTGVFKFTLEGDDPISDGTTFTTTTNFGEDTIKAKTLWCADGGICEIPKGNAYINLPVMSTAGSDAQSQVIRVGNWEIGQNSAGSLQFTNMISVPGPVVGTFVPTRGNVFTMNTQGNFKADGDVIAGGNLNVTSSTGNIKLYGGWNITPKETELQFNNGADWKSVVSKDGNLSARKNVSAVQGDVYANLNVMADNIIARGNLMSSTGNVNLTNLWKVSQNSVGNLQFTNNTTGKSTIITATGDVVADNDIRATGKLYTDGGLIGLTNGWTLKTDSQFARFQKDNIDKVYFNSSGNLYAANDMYANRDVYAGSNLTASAGNINLYGGWNITPTETELQFRNGAEWKSVVSKDGDLNARKNVSAKQGDVYADANVMGNNIVARGNLTASAGNVNLSNGWKLNTDSDMNFRKDGADKAWVNSSGDLRGFRDVTAWNGDVTALTGNVTASKDVKAGGNLYATGGNVYLSNGWRVNSNDSYDINFYKGSDWRGIISKDGDVIANRKLDTRGGNVNLSNGWTLNTDSGNARFRYNDIDKVYFNSSGNLYVKGNETGIGNGWTLKTDDNLMFKNNDSIKTYITPSGNLYSMNWLYAINGGLQLKNNWRINTDGGNMNFEYAEDWKGAARTDGKVVSRN
jgi:nitrogen fixation protein